jgi:hypothetical protein
MPAKTNVAQKTMESSAVGRFQNPHYLASSMQANERDSCGGGKGQEDIDLSSGSDASALPPCSMIGREGQKEGKMCHEKPAAVLGKLTVVLIALSVLLGPFDLTAREKRGAWLRIEKIDGSWLDGELLSVKENSILVMANGQGRIVGLDDIDSLIIVNKSKAVSKMGAAIGYAAILGFAIGLLQGSDKDGWFRSSALQKGFYWAVLLSPFAGLAGISSGISSGKDEKFDLRKTSYSSLVAVLRERCRFH